MTPDRSHLPAGPEASTVRTSTSTSTSTINANASISPGVPPRGTWSNTPAIQGGPRKTSTFRPVRQVRERVLRSWQQKGEGEERCARRMYSFLCQNEVAPT
ncbi:unnamed protein product [Ectocarpus sp. 8 AP-2014]